MKRRTVRLWRNRDEWGGPLRSRQPSGLVAAGVVAALVAPLGLAGTAAASATPTGPPVGVVVRERPGAGDAPERAVASLGGKVGRPLGIIDGFSAEVPEEALARLRALPGVAAVTRDASVRLLDSDWDEPAAKGSLNTSDKVGEWKADADYGSVWTTAKATDASDLYGISDPRGQKITGKGVTVAVIDSGVAPVKGLDAPGKVVRGPDLSFESQVDDLRHLDTYGHGTHMAGIIAGRDAETPIGKEDDPRYFVGVAPDAKVLSVKVAAADGATDVSQIIAALDWVVAHRNDNGMNVRVINLSFGTDSVQSYTLDPLAYAAEVAWRKGIVVVVSAGNDGLGVPRLTNPAIDPYVIAVAAGDFMGTDKVDDDVVTPFTNRGNSMRRPDLTAPGTSIVSLRVPGSYVDLNHPEGRVADRFFRGSGTSQAAAFVSGVAALLIQERPSITPDELKRLLTTSAMPMPMADSVARGAGRVDPRLAQGRATPSYAQTWAKATGLGSLEAARGTSHVYDGGIELNGERDIFGTSWNGVRWSSASLAGTSWSGGFWNGVRWTGDAWSTTGWSGAQWTSSAWSGARWSSDNWSGARWSGARWSSDAWSGARWSGARWSGARWSSNGWTANSFG